MGFRKYVQAVMVLQFVLALPAFAVRMGIGTISADVTGTLSDNVSCSLVTFDNAAYDVFGNSVNLGTQVQQLFCTGQTIAGVQQPGHCASIVPDAWGFDLTNVFLCNPPTCLGNVSFVSASVFNVTGTTPAALGSLTYTSDGAGDFISFNPSTSIPGCPIVGGVVHFEGTFGANAFQPVTTPSGTDVEISSNTTFFNPVTNQTVDLTIGIGFAAVGTPGETLVTATSNNSGVLSANFAASIDGYQAAFLDISTTAVIAPPIIVCSSYPDATNDGIIDGTSISETALRILHGEGDPVVFVDRTVSQDTTANEICAEVDSLSPFVTVVNLCGNSTVNSGETCDDGNPNAGDGCSDACQTEPGWQCTTPGSSCTFVCGNSTVNSSETCDDGDSTGGDGCSATCQLEPGWQCPTPGSACTYVCGNSSLNPGEQCDDGDASGGDGCSAACQIETCFTCNNSPLPSTCTPLSAVSCDDGDLCTTDDMCLSGVCAGDPVGCSALGTCFDAGTCNPLTGVCSNPPKSDGASCSDGDGCAGDTCQDAQCQPVSCPAVDAMVLNRAPLNVTIGATATSVAKVLVVKVRNADSVDRIIELAVSTDDCPGSLAGSPEFNPSPLAADTSILVPAGKMKTAKVPLLFQHGDFTSFNFKAPKRCTLELSASAVVAGGSNDPTPANNVTLVEVNVIDKHDPEQATTHETIVKSVAPKVLNIPDNKSSKAMVLKAVIGNADYRPSAEVPGDLISLTASTTCVGLSLSTPICDPPTLSDEVTVKGGATKSCKVTANAFSAPISTANKLSPQRCTVTLAAHGPNDPETAPRDASNNSTVVNIDLLDKNDH